MSGVPETAPRRGGEHSSVVTHPRPNRVTPFGELEASSAKGSLMGNRGDLHEANGRLGLARWKGTRWISCTTKELRPGVTRTFDTQGFYYPLFFHDEYVALAAGHRPCVQCRFDAWQEFALAWARAGQPAASSTVRATDVDRHLHAERLTGRRQRRRRATLADLPPGTFVVLPGDAEVAAIVTEQCLRPWTHHGYLAPVVVGASWQVEVLTPAPLVEVLRQKYRLLDASTLVPVP